MSDANENADKSCGPGEFNWATQKSEAVITKIEEDLFESSANFQCCMSW